MGFFSGKKTRPIEEKAKEVRKKDVWECKFCGAKYATKEERDKCCLAERKAEENSSDDSSDEDESSTWDEDVVQRKVEVYCKKNNLTLSIFETNTYSDINNETICKDFEAYKFDVNTMVFSKLNFVIDSKGTVFTKDSSVDEDNQ